MKTARVTFTPCCGRSVKKRAHVVGLSFPAFEMANKGFIMK